MKLLLVTFSLRNATKDYSSFHVTMRGNALNWWHFIEQTCVVSTNHDAHDFALLLYPHLETTDSLLVVEVQPYQFQGWLPKEAWDWFWDTSNKIKQLEIPFPGMFLPPPPPKELK
jgi:hypothetical protein